MALHHIDPAGRGRAIGEMRRVLRPGGRLVIADAQPMQQAGFAAVTRTDTSVSWVGRCCHRHRTRRIRLASALRGDSWAAGGSRLGDAVQALVGMSDESGLTFGGSRRAERAGGWWRDPGCWGWPWPAVVSLVAVGDPDEGCHEGKHVDEAEDGGPRA